MSSTKNSIKVSWLLTAFFLLLNFSLSSLQAETGFLIDSSIAPIGAAVPHHFNSVYDAASNRTFVVFPEGQSIACNSTACSGATQCSESTSTLRIYDHGTNQWLTRNGSNEVAVGDALIGLADAHSYPVLVIDGNHKLHIFSGGHVNPIVHLVSLDATTSSASNLLNPSRWTSRATPSQSHLATYPLAYHVDGGAAGDFIYLFWRQTEMDPNRGDAYYYEPIYVSYTENGGVSWSAPVKLLDPAPLDTYDTIYIDGVWREGYNLHMVFSNRLNHNDSIKAHYFVTYNFSTRRLYHANGSDLGTRLLQKGSGSILGFEEVAGLELVAPLAQNQGYASVAIGRDYLGRINVFQSNNNRRSTCSCSGSTKKRSVDHFWWNGSSWSKTEYFTSTTASSAINVDPYQVRFDPSADRFELFVRIEGTCKSSTSCPSGGSTCQMTNTVRLSNWEREAGRTPLWQEKKIAELPTSQLHDDRYRQLGFTLNAPTNSPIQGLFVSGTVLDWVGTDAWKYPRNNNALYTWNGTYLP